MDMSNPTLNREGWLHAFAEAIAPVIKARTGLNVPLSRIRLSCSFPKGRATPNRKGVFTTGQCWHGDSHASGLHEIMINPLRERVIDDKGEGVAETIIHELLHASLPKGTGHKAPFARAAKAMGLEGKPTATVAGADLVALIRKIAEPIGDYPHKALAGEWGKKQTTRLLKVQCVDCGYINEAGNGYTARITMTWIESAGLPICPCGATMSLIMDDDDDRKLISLKPVESSATYRVPAEGEGFDDRFQIRRVSSEHFGERWTVIDFGERITDGMVNLDATPRITAAESKTDAMMIVEALREGLYTPDYLDDDQDWDDDDDGSNPLSDEDPDLDALIFIGDDEDEDPEHPEDAEPEVEWTRVHPVTQREFVHTFDYEAISEARESAGVAKSERIAAGAEGALD
jgi:hypothetical protein